MASVDSDSGCVIDAGDTGDADECIEGQRGNNKPAEPKNRIGRNRHLGLRLVWTLSTEFGWERWVQ